MHNREKQLNIPAELADNLIDSLGDLTAIEGDELRRQVVMLINHSYALVHVAGAGAGFVARMQSRLARARRRAGQDIKLALSAIRERLTMIFRDHGRRSHQMFPQRPSCRAARTDGGLSPSKSNESYLRRRPRSSRTKMAEGGKSQFRECDAMQTHHPRANRSLQHAIHAFPRSLPLPVLYRRPSQWGVVRFRSR